MLGLAPIAVYGENVTRVVDTMRLFDTTPGYLAGLPGTARSMVDSAYPTSG